MHDQFLFGKTGDADGAADGAVISPRKGQEILALFRCFLTADEGRQDVEVLQVFKEDDVRPLARCQGAAVVEVVAVGGVEGRHGDSRLRRQAGGDAEAQVFVEVAFLKDRLGMEVIRTEQEAAQIGRRHGPDQIWQVMAGRTVAQHDVHAGLEARFDVVQGETFVVRPDLGRRIGLQVLASDAGAVAVDGLFRLIGGDELVQDGIIAVQDARAVHEFTDTENAVVGQGRFHVVCFQHGPAVVERRRRDTRRHHETDVQGRLFSGFHHVTKAGQAADVDDFMRVGDDRRRSQGDDQAAELFRADIGRFDMDMAFNEARCGIGPMGIDDFLSFIRAADAGDDAVGDDDIPRPDGLCIDVDDLAVFKDDVPRFQAPGYGNTPFQKIPCHSHNVLLPIGKGVRFLSFGLIVP